MLIRIRPASMIPLIPPGRSVVFALAIIAGLVCGCGPYIDSPNSRLPFSYRVTNVNGPPSRIVINGHEVAGISCQVSIDITDGHYSPPPLPWQVSVERADGRDEGPWEVDGSRPQVLFIFFDGNKQMDAPGNPGQMPRSPVACPT